jgi:hypothetical protein
VATLVLKERWCHQLVLEERWRHCFWKRGGDNGCGREVALFPVRHC